MTAGRATKRLNSSRTCPFDLPEEHHLRVAEWASRERAFYTKQYQALPKLKTISGTIFSSDNTEDTLGIPIFVDRTIQICEDYLIGCLTREIAAHAYERLVKSIRRYSVPWNLVGHVISSAISAFPSDTELKELHSWALKMNKPGSLYDFNSLGVR